jgi:recombination protein RecT
MPSDNAVAIQPVKPMDRFRQDLTLREHMIKALLPQNVTFEKFMAAVVAAVGNNPKLLECDRGSLIKSCIQAAELGLSLNPTLGECDILSVYDKQRGSVAQFRPRYMGLMKLARQSGEVLKIEAEIVREFDEFLFQKGSDPRLEHRIKLSNRGEMVGAYCVWTLKNGEKQFEVMDRDQIIAIRDRSSAKTKEGKIVGPWNTDPEEMWRKTVVRRASKYMPRSCDGFVSAVAIDTAREGGVDGDVIDMETGEVIDITEAREDVKPTSQVDALAAKIKSAPKKDWAPDLLEVGADDDGMSDWSAWCSEAVSAVTPLDKSQVNAWVKAHRNLLDEAELMAPRESKALMELLSK